MSYDCYMQIDTGGEYPATVAEMGNYTSNCSPMWRKAISEATKRNCGLGDLEGKTGAELIPILEAAVSHMRHPANRADYTALNPTNGWGEYASAAKYLEGILTACREHPKAFLHVSA